MEKQNINIPEPATPREWLRVKEACEYSRMSKAALYARLNRGLIKSVSLKERGQVKGTRLISFDSLRAFLESRSSGGETLTANIR
jgi:hypothetical protein